MENSGNEKLLGVVNIDIKLILIVMLTIKR